MSTVFTPTELRDQEYELDTYRCEDEEKDPVKVIEDCKGEEVCDLEQQENAAVHMKEFETALSNYILKEE